jgi:predicted signal transduction protein with EAL and GGDEF domain
VLAEGIEDATVCQALLAMDCYEGQGYHIARPMNKSALLEWLQAHCLDADAESRTQLMAPSVELSLIHGVLPRSVRNNQ